MTSHALVIGIAIGMFFAGLGVGYAALQSTVPATPMAMTPQQMQQMMDNPDMMNRWMDTVMNNSQTMQRIHQQMMNDPEHMKAMMSDPQYMQRMTDMMDQNPAMRQHMMERMNQNMNAGEFESTNHEMRLKMQDRERIGLMIQDPEIRQQMQKMLAENMQQPSPLLPTDKETVATAESSDGTITVNITSSTPQPGKFFEIVETFHDKDGKIMEHVNHDIHVTQDGKTVLKMSELHSHHGEVTYFTRELQSGSPVIVTVRINGIGMQEPLTGPIGEEITVEIS